MEMLLLISVAFAPLAFAAVEPWAFGPLYAVFFGLAAYIFITGRARGDNPLYKNLLPAVLAVAAIGLAQTIRENPVNAPSALVFTVWRPSTLNAVAVWLFYASVLYCVPRIITTRERLERLLWTVFAVGVFIALMGMLQKTGENTMVYGLRRVRGQPFGPFVNRDHGANFLVMSAMAGLGLFFSGFRALRAHQSRTRFFDLLAVQLLKLVMVGTVVYGIFHTGSRGGLHAFALVAAAAGLVSAAYIRTKTIKIAVYTGLIFLAAGYGLFISRNRILLGLEDGKLVNTVTMRFSMYQSGARMLGDFPVFGVGLGAVEHAFPYYKLSGVPATSLVHHVHSDWLELFLQVGLAGGLIYLAGLLTALCRFLKTWAGARSFSGKSLYGGALCAVAAASAHNFVEFGSQMPANSLVFYALLGALASKPAIESSRFRGSEDMEPAAPEPAPRLFAAPAAVLAALLAASSIPQFIAWRCEQLAKTAPPGRKPELRTVSLKYSPGPQAAFRLGADYYNRGLRDRADPCGLFYRSRRGIAPYLRRAAVNYDLNRLDEKLRGKLAYCYNPRGIRAVPPPAPLRGSSP